MKQWIEEVCFCSVSPVDQLFFSTHHFFLPYFSHFPSVCVEAFFPGQGHSLPVLVLFLQWEKAPFHLRLLCTVAYFWYSKDFKHLDGEKWNVDLSGSTPVSFADFLHGFRQVIVHLSTTIFQSVTQRQELCPTNSFKIYRRFLPELNIVLLKLIENIHV